MGHLQDDRPGTRIAILLVIDASDLPHPTAGRLRGEQGRQIGWLHDRILDGYLFIGTPTEALDLSIESFNSDRRRDFLQFVDPFRRALDQESGIPRSPQRVIRFE